MLISPIYGSRVYNKQNNNVQFTGLTKRMEREMYIDGKKDILEIINQRGEDKNTIVGQLPPGMFYKLPKENRAEAITEIMNTFAEASNEIRPFVPSAKGSELERKNLRPDSAVEKLRSVFEKYDLIEPDKEFDLKYLGQGYYGKVYKLEGLYDNKTNDKYVMKVYKTVDKGPEWHPYKSHGNYAELNTAAYWMKNLGRNTQRGRFFFGDITSGFMVCNFIDNNKPKPEKIVNEYTKGAKLTDEELNAIFGHNRINGYSIDWGGVRVVNRIKNKNKTANYVLTKIQKTRPEEREIEWWKIYNNKRLDKAGKKAGLALSLKYMKKPDAYIIHCLDEKNQLVDISVAYALKYLPYEKSKKIFDQLMKKGDSLTQVVLMNEIPLLARNQRDADKYDYLNLPKEDRNSPIDDMNVPKDEINPKKIRIYYRIAAKHATPLSQEHLASYVHLLPEKDILKEFEKLIQTKDERVYERLIHKMRIVREDEFPMDIKFKMIDKLEKEIENPYLLKKLRETKTYIIRCNLDND